MSVTQIVDGIPGAACMPCSETTFAWPHVRRSVPAVSKTRTGGTVVARCATWISVAPLVPLAIATAVMREMLAYAAGMLLGHPASRT